MVYLDLQSDPNNGLQTLNVGMKAIVLGTLEIQAYFSACAYLHRFICASTARADVFTVPASTCVYTSHIHAHTHTYLPPYLPTYLPTLDYIRLH